MSRRHCSAKSHRLSSSGTVAVQLRRRQLRDRWQVEHVRVDMDLSHDRLDPLLYLGEPIGCIGAQLIELLTTLAVDGLLCSRPPLAGDAVGQRL